MLANVKIEQDKQHKIIHRVFVNGKKMERVNHVDFNNDVAEVPQVNVGIAGGFNFEGMAEIHFDYSPYTVKESCKILRDELLKHGDLYRAFSSSIYSALHDLKECSWADEVADIILDRLIGDEQTCT